jgi:NADH:ubiquinone oxidoreductase subunit D
MIEAHGSALDRLLIAVNEMHDSDKVIERVQELEEEGQMPVAQLLRNCIEENATDEEKA